MMCSLHPEGSPVRAAEPYTLDQCRRCWVVAGGVVGKRARAAERGRCLHLGKRVEYRPGCGGRLCLHECLAGEPQAVPGGVCQTCPKWESD